MAGPHVFKKAVDDDNLLTSCQGNGPYYNTMDGFASMSAEWFDMLQKITSGGGELQRGYGALAMFTFINAWNDHFLQLIMLRSPANLTISLGISTLRRSAHVTIKSPGRLGEKFLHARPGHPDVAGRGGHRVRRAG